MVEPALWTNVARAVGTGALVMVGLSVGAVNATACEAAGPPIDLARALSAKDGSLAHLWGKENLTILPEPGSSGTALRIAYPAGSFSPGQSPVRGGAGFELRARGSGATTACLTYRVRFPVGFDFVKGGKLPGLFGGDAPRGCVGDGGVTGFSARLMWRAGGAGELYLYAPGRDTRCGQSIGRGAWTFTPGAWTSVSEAVTINPSATDQSSVEVWIDGRSVVKAEGLTLARGSAGTVDGLLFSTFFGGSDTSWASPTDQTADFSDFRLTAGNR